jgi:hypothetical protein
MSWGEGQANLFGRITRAQCWIDGHQDPAAAHCITWQRAGPEKLVAGRRWLLDPSTIGSRIAANSEDFDPPTAASGRCGGEAREPHRGAGLRWDRSADLRRTDAVDRNQTSAGGVLREALMDRLTVRALALRWIWLESPRGSHRLSLQMPSREPLRDRVGLFTGTACSRRRFCAHQQKAGDILLLLAPLLITRPGRADPQGRHGATAACRAGAARAGRAHRSWPRPQVALTMLASAKEQTGTVDRTAKARTARRRQAWPCAGLLGKA